MYGADMGTLRLKDATGGVQWSLSGNQGTAWQEATVALSTAGFTFEGVRGSGEQSDMAVDDVAVTCHLMPPPPPPSRPALPPPPARPQREAQRRALTRRRTTPPAPPFSRWVGLLGRSKGRGGCPACKRDPPDRSCR